MYEPAPTGVDLVTLAYAYSTGAVLFDKTIPVEDATADIHSVTAAYSRSIGLFGMAGRADVALPLVSGDWTGIVATTDQNTSLTGFGDPTLRLALFFYGAPALTREEFRRFKPETVVGGTLRLKLPLGQYDADRFVNVGSNRWVISPQVGVSRLADRVLLEAYVGAWFFTDNDEFLGTSTFSQRPLYALQVHVSYKFQGRWWVAGSSRQSLGGASSVNGGDKLAPEANNRVGLTVGVPVTRLYALKVSATTGLTATAGNDYTTFAVAGQIVF